MKKRSRDSAWLSGLAMAILSGCGPDIQPGWSGNLPITIDSDWVAGTRANGRWTRLSPVEDARTYLATPDPTGRYSVAVRRDGEGEDGHPISTIDIHQRHVLEDVIDLVQPETMDVVVQVTGLTSEVTKVEVVSAADKITLEPPNDSGMLRIPLGVQDVLASASTSTRPVAFLARRGIAINSQTGPLELDFDRAAPYVERPPVGVQGQVRIGIAVNENGPVLTVVEHCCETTTVAFSLPEEELSSTDMLVSVTDYEFGPLEDVRVKMDFQATLFTLEDAGLPTGFVDPTAEPSLPPPVNVSDGVSIVLTDVVSTIGFVNEATVEVRIDDGANGTPRWIRARASRSWRGAAKEYRVPDVSHVPGLEEGWELSTPRELQLRSVIEYPLFFDTLPGNVSLTALQRVELP